MIDTSVDNMIYKCVHCMIYISVNHMIDKTVDHVMDRSVVSVIYKFVDHMSENCFRLCAWQPTLQHKTNKTV